MRSEVLGPEIMSPLSLLFCLWGHNKFRDVVMNMWCCMKYCWDCQAWADADISALYCSLLLFYFDRFKHSVGSVGPWNSRSSHSLCVSESRSTSADGQRIRFDEFNWQNLAQSELLICSELPTVPASSAAHSAGHLHTSSSLILLCLTLISGISGVTECCSARCVGGLESPGKNYETKIFVFITQKSKSWEKGWNIKKKVEMSRKMLKYNSISRCAHLSSSPFVDTQQAFYLVRTVN